MRRLRALAALDPEVGAVIAARDQRRRTGLALLIERTARHPASTIAARSEDAVRVLHTLTSFETFDSLAGSGNPTDVIPVVVELAGAALGAPLTTAHE
jgi:hypothetical protein